MGNANTKKDIVVIDIEATGVDTETNEIIGLSAVLLQSEKVAGLKYETWCNAPEEFDKEALKIIGKKIGFFEDQPSLSDAIKNLGDFINSRRVVALNPTFCSALLYKSGLSRKIKVEDALTIVRKNLEGFAPYDYDDFLWSDWLSGPLQKIQPCCHHLKDDFDTMLIGKFLEISFNDNLRGQLESTDLYDD
jgi:DNA polymerase III alpha subunit (gram-positive type)